MKEKDPKVLEQRKKVRGELDKKRKQFFAKADGHTNLTESSITDSTQYGAGSIATDQTSRFNHSLDRNRKTLSKKSKTQHDVTASLMEPSREEGASTSQHDLHSSVNQSTNN